MPCKHEGGTDACERDRWRRCLVSRKENKRQRYLKEFKPNRIPPSMASDRGAAGEHFVIHWLLARGFQVGGPYNQNGKHDLFVKLSDWKTVQVKVGRPSRITGTLAVIRGQNGVTSDLIAMVSLEDQRLRWISNTDEPLPKELL